jgi:hypothetical protein
MWNITNETWVAWMEHCLCNIWNIANATYETSFMPHMKHPLRNIWNITCVTYETSPMYIWNITYATFKNEIHMLMIMNEWMMLMLVQCKCKCKLNTWGVTWTVMGKAVSFNRPKMGPNGPDWSQWAQISPSLLGYLQWSSGLGPWWYSAQLRCLDLGLALFSTSFGPYFAWLWAFLHWDCVEWYLCFVLLHIFSPFMCIYTNTLLQMVNHQNSWISLVVRPNSKFGDQLCRYGT